MSRDFGNLKSGHTTVALIFAVFLTGLALGKNSELADAAELKKWATVKTLLANKEAEPNQPQVDGMTALHWATYHDDTATVLQLLAAGADPSARNRYGVTPLSLACTNGNAKAVTGFFKAGADPNSFLKGGETVLMTASRSGNVDVVNELIKRGAKIASTDGKGQSALMWASTEGHADIVNALLKAGADPNKTTKSGFTPLFFAARDGRISAVQTLLSAGVDVNYQKKTDRSGGKAPQRGTDGLRLAVENGHYELAVILLEAGADPNAQNSGFTPLHVLTWVRKPNRGDGNDGSPPPIGSGDLSSLDFARLLITKYGADPNIRLQNGTAGGTRLSTRGATAFLLAAKTADLPYLKLLAELGADITIPNANGTTPLMAAAGVGTYAPTEEAGTEDECIAVVDWLLSQGAKINYLNNSGDSVMHGAAYKSLPKMAAFLHTKGADIKFWNLKNKRGHTPLLIAQGFRQGNFKPSPETIVAIEKVMRANGVEPPPAPKRPIVGKPKEYQK